jgi:hypothetical protein
LQHIPSTLDGLDSFIGINDSANFGLLLCALCIMIYLELCVSTLDTGNIGNVPLVLIAALRRDKSNPFGASETCSKDGTAYISFGQWVGFDLNL